LIRFSNKVGCYAASFVGKKDSSLSVLQGLITTTNGFFQVNGQGILFPTLDELVKHYNKEKILVTPLKHSRLIGE